MRIAELLTRFPRINFKRKHSRAQRGYRTFQLTNPVLDRFGNAKAALYVLNDFVSEIVPLLLAKHCPAVLAIVGHSRARLVHAPGATTLSEWHPPVNLVDGDAFEIHRLQQAQRGFIRKAAAFWIACALFGYYLAYMAHALADRSGQW